VALEDFRFTTQIEVRFRDCDSMGHVNNAVYLTYLEQARFAYWRQVLQGRGAPPPKMILARAECDFVTAAGFGDLLDVRMRVSAIGRTSFTAEYEILQARDRRLVAKATSVQVMYDYDAGRPVPIADEVRGRIEDFEGKSLSQRKA
jgi:acyl-CoA thioester hydrolase